MRRRHARHPSVVGLLAIIVIAVITFFGVTRWNPFHHGYRLHGIFSSALSNGIHPGSFVRIAGVNVGQVTNVERGPGTTVDVTMDMSDPGLPIHRDATAKARPRIFLEGNFFIDLQPGTPEAPVLRNGEAIPLSQTAVATQFDQVLDTFTADARASERDLLTGLATSLRHGGAEALRADYRALPAPLRSTAVVMQSLRGTRTGDLAGFIARQADVSQTLDDHAQELSDLITGFRRTMDAFASRQRALAATLPALARLLNAAPRSLDDLDRLLPPLRTFSVALRASLPIAPRVLDHAGGFLAELYTTMAPERLDALVKALGPVTARLRDLERALPALMNLVRPVSRCTSAKVLPVISKPVDDGPLSTHQPPWQDLLHGLLGLNSAQQNYGGNGYSTRYSFGLDQNVLATNLDVPGRLVMLSGTRLLGARPRWTPGTQPPFRPDVPCETQPLQSNVAETAAVPPITKHIRLYPVKPWTRAQLVAHLRASVAAMGKR